VSANVSQGTSVATLRGRQVALPDTARELRHSWMVADDEARRTRGEGMLRLREVNLVVYAVDQGDAEPARATAARFMREHPGRVIVLRPLAARGDPLRSEGLSAAISTGCFLDRSSGHQVCSEEVVIAVGPREERAAQAAVHGLLVPDLPVLGWWAGKPAPLDPNLQWLAGVSDQLVVDSALADVPAQRTGSGGGMQALADLLDNTSRVNVSDLTWMRIAPWRALTAELFDDPARRLLIPRISRLSVEYRGVPAQALLHAAWFGSRLGMSAGGHGWRPEGAGHRVALKRDSTLRGERVRPPLEMELREMEPSGGALSGLAGMRVFAEPAGPLPAISIQRQPGDRVCSGCVAAWADEVLVKTVEVSPDEEWQLLTRAFETRRSDTVFAETVRLAATLGDLPT
jgi:hypothetical protein